MDAGNTERAPIESCLRRAHLAEAEKIWLSTHGEDFYRRMMAPKLPDLKMGDRVIHENRGAGTFEHYKIGRRDCFVKFDGESSSERVTTSMVSLAAANSKKQKP